MKTTALVVELVLAGLVVELALVLLIDALADGSVVPWLLSSESSYIPLMGLVFAYFLGSVTNSLAGTLAAGDSRKIREQVTKLDEDTWRRSRQAVFRASSEWRAHLEYIYGQIRVLRSATLAFVILGVVVAGLGVPGLDGLGPYLGVVISCFALATGSYLVVRKNMRAYHSVMVACHELLAGDGPKQTDTDDEPE